MADKCERCGYPTDSHANRLCGICLKVVLRSMASAGDRRPVPPSRRYRTYDMRENTYETKYGID